MGDNVTHNYCSDECRKKGWLKKAEEGNPYYHICEECGKAYKRDPKKKGHFCSKDCYLEAMDKGWTSPDRLTAPGKTMKIRTKCAACGKAIEKQVRLPYDGLTTFVCNRECKQAYLERQDELKRAQLAKDKARKEAERRRKAEEAVKELERQRLLEQTRKEKEESTPLCASCRTPYSDCERMQSEFRVIPKGAHYNSRGVLRICPKYKA